MNKPDIPRAPSRLTFNWLLTYDVSKDGGTANVAIKHVGWDTEETDHVFVRVE